MEGCQHPLHFPQLFLKSSNLVLVNDVKRASAFELIVHLERGREGNLEISGELALTPLAGAFRDVVGDRVDRAEELGTETWCGATKRSSEDRTVACDGQLVGLLPDFDLSNGVHAGKVGSLRPDCGTITSQPVTFPRDAQCRLPSACCRLASTVCSSLPSAVSVRGV